MNILFLAHDSVMYDRMGIMSLSAVLKKDGHLTKLAYTERLGPEGLDALMKSFQPEIVAYSVTTGEHLAMLKVNSELKKGHNFFSVFGGPHPTFFPDLIEEDNVDAICIGEGDTAFSDLCGRLESKSEYWTTPNFYVMHNDQICRNPVRNLIENLDDLPFPDRDIMYEADPEHLACGNKIVNATRGCPFQCTYCFNHKYNDIYANQGAVLRHRSPEKVVEEICSMRERFPLDTFWFSDDTFLMKPKGWIERFSELYKARVGIPFLCNVRANVVNEEVMRLLKDAGLHSVWMGVECGNEDVANRILHRNLSNEQLSTAARIIKIAGIKLGTQSLSGLPVPDSYEEDLRTLDFNLNLAPTYGWASILYPYPGTWISEYAKEHGYLRQGAKLLETNKRSSMLTFSSPMEKRRIENLHKLYSLILYLPFLRRYCNFLCSLPLTRVYHIIYYLVYGYGLKIRLWPLRLSRRTLRAYISLFFRMVRKT